MNWCCMCQRRRNVLFLQNVTDILVAELGAMNFQLTALQTKVLITNSGTQPIQIETVGEVVAILPGRSKHKFCKTFFFWNLTLRIEIEVRHRLHATHPISFAAIGNYWTQRKIFRTMWASLVRKFWFQRVGDELCNGWMAILNAAMFLQPVSGWSDEILKYPGRRP